MTEDSPHALRRQENELPVALARRHFQEHVHGDPPVHHVLPHTQTAQSYSTVTFRQIRSLEKLAFYFPHRSCDLRKGPTLIYI